MYSPSWRSCQWQAARRHGRFREDAGQCAARARRAFSRRDAQHGEQLDGRQTLIGDAIDAREVGGHRIASRI
jgi:hypothetical protein